MHAYDMHMCTFVQTAAAVFRTLSAIGAGRTMGVTHGSFLACAYRQLSVALVCSQGFVYRDSASANLGVLFRPIGL